MFLVEVTLWNLCSLGKLHSYLLIEVLQGKSCIYFQLEIVLRYLRFLESDIFKYYFKFIFLYFSLFYIMRLDDNSKEEEDLQDIINMTSNIKN